MSDTRTTFGDLNQGDTFDFVEPGSLCHSFTARCRKISPRGYEWNDPKHGRLQTNVGTIKAMVYNVEPESGETE